MSRAATDYRPDIDGLRAIAVLSVVLFHAEVAFIGGGFVGIDVFFVISGFLITSLILRERVEGHFSLSGFYERRIRRIVPALVLVLIATTAAGWIVLLPTQFDAYARSLLATTVFLSNVYFELTTDYFAIEAHRRVLLHTWSLAVEEQYYLVFPLAVLLIGKFSQRALPWVIAVALAASFGYGAIAVTQDKAAAFFQTSGRVWELLLGALLAFGPRVGSGRRVVNELLSWTGAAMIGASILLLDRTTPFPGPAALLPCIGTALLIHANRNSLTVVGRALAWQPVMFVGLISYSLYLWHWPILTFARIELGRALTDLETALLIALSLALAILTWRYVEQPFRRRRALPRRAPLLVGFTASIVTFLLIAYAIGTNNGFPQRWSPQIVRYDLDRIDNNAARDFCSAVSPERIRAGDLCRLGPAGPPRFLVWGDSQALAYMPAFAALADANGVAGLFASYRACAPLLGVARSPTQYDRCVPFNDAMMEFVRQSALRDIVLIARWPYYTHGSHSEEDVFDGGRIYDAETSDPGETQRLAIFQGGVERTLAALAETGIRIWLVEQLPELSEAGPDLLIQAVRRGDDPNTVGLGTAEHRRRQSFVAETFDELAARFEFSRLDPASRLCDAARCRIGAEGRSLYRDADHVSNFGALWFSDLFAPIVTMETGDEE